jgi:hypothetical protein
VGKIEDCVLPEGLLVTLWWNDVGSVTVDDGKAALGWADAPKATPRPTPTPSPLPAGEARDGVTVWGGTAHLEVAASSDCADLQSWFDAADQVRDSYLRNSGPDDPDYEYALELVDRADDRMRATGCYD